MTHSFPTRRSSDLCAIILRFRYDPGQIMPPADLDAIDRRILRVLQENARIPNVDLAQAVGLSPSPCLRRVRDLEERGVVRRYVGLRSEEHTSELQSLMRISYAVFCLKKKKT